jgi:hypothetical protein
VNGAAPRPRYRVYSVGVPVWNALYRRLWLLAWLPALVFFPLLNARGLYEYADTNFPLNPFWLDYILPWSGAASAGADNTFVGVPRLVYHVTIDALIATFHNLQLGQWLWFSGEGALGIVGAFLLARRLGAGRYAVPLSIFYTLNLWSYDRVAQSLIFLSYQALPLAVFLFLRYLDRPRLDRALYFALSILLIIPAPQMTYIALIVCTGIAVRHVALTGWRGIVPLAAAAGAVLAATAFYVFTMVADWKLNSGGDIALVNQRFTLDTFLYYASRVGIWNTARLSSFFYSTFDHQTAVVTVACSLLPFLLLGLVLLARRPSLRSRFYCGLALALLGLWLVDGVRLAPAAYQWFRIAVPGLRSFVEPDYYSPLFILGAFAMLASALRLGARILPLTAAAVWFVALAGIVPFLPIGRPLAGMPQTAQPHQYADFSRSHVLGNTFWIPADRDVTYRWSPYVINGFTSLNSPSDAIGPTMQEWVSGGTDRLQGRMSEALEVGQLNTVRALAPLLGVGTIAIAADSLGPQKQWPNYEVEGSLATLHKLASDGFVTSVVEQRDDGVRLVVGTTQPPPLDIGVYDAPLAFRTFDDFLWWQMARPGVPYRPAAADSSSAARVGDVALQVAPPAPLRTLRLPASQFASVGNCRGKSAALPKNRRAQLVVTTVDALSCVTLVVPNPKRFRAVEFAFRVRNKAVVFPWVSFSDKHQTHFVEGAHPISEVPFWATRIGLIGIVPPHERLVLGGVDMRWISGAARLPASPSACVRSDVHSWEVNPLVYAVAGDLRGTCSVVFRQSFAPVWKLWVRGTANVAGHFQADGFANGWVIHGNGPVTLYAVNVLIVPYCIGMAVTLVCLALTAAVALRALVRRFDAAGSRRATSAV